MVPDPNLFAFIVLFSWPLIAIKIYKKYSTDLAVILLFLVPFLLLPVKTEVDLPLIPPLDKRSVPALMVFFLCYFYIKDLRLMPQTDMVRRLFIVLFLFPLFTYLANTDTLVYGPKVFAGLTFSDLIQMTFFNLTLFYLPFILGEQYLTSNESHKKLLVVLVCAGLLYSIPMIWEVRTSPRLHSQIYGFFPHDWRQQIREGGFRPVVFLGHGLVVAIFACFVTLAAVTLFRQKIRAYSKLPALFVVLYMLGTLVLCKSLGSLLYAIVFAPVLLLLSARAQVRVATIFVAVVFLFPFFRSEGFIPVKAMTSYFEGISPERAQSLQFRFDNEDILLEKANIRKLFGWGTWGRNRVFDPIRGTDLSVTDGYWILVFGQFGWFGYIAIFGILAYPVYMLLKVSGKRNAQALLSPYTACVAILVTVNMIDLLPNSSITHLTFLFAGAVLGRAEAIKRELEAEELAENLSVENG